MSNAFAKWFAALWLSGCALVALVGSAVSFVAEAADCDLSTPEFASMDMRRIGLQDELGNVVQLRVRIADTGPERAAGFQHICPEIIDLSAILFVFDYPTTVQFHMFNVHKSLDIAFISESREVVSIQRMEPQQADDPDAVYYRFEQEFLYALETAPGFFSQHGLESGHARLIFY